MSEEKQVVIVGLSIIVRLLLGEEVHLTNTVLIPDSILRNAADDTRGYEEVCTGPSKCQP